MFSAAASSHVAKLARAARAHRSFAPKARAFSAGKDIPQSVHGIDLETLEKTPEESRVHNRSEAESKFKLGKHRSNALDLLNQLPVIEVEGEMAICDGGGGPLGHPLEYISLQRPGVIERCKYCGLRFKSKSWAKQ